LRTIRLGACLRANGSFEVRFADGRSSRFFYFDDVLARRLRPELLTRGQALAASGLLSG
jgi:hypothetical protein